MSTRRIYGFHINGTDKLAYNHSDSYPRVLGVTILSQLRAVQDWELVKERIASLIAIRETRELGNHADDFRVELRRHYPDLQYKSEPRDYYKLMAPLQGTLEPYLSGKLSFMATANEFIDDSLFCEWGYIANLDTHLLEVYRGLQTEKLPEQSRYREGPDRMGYYSCRMVGGYKLDSLPTKSMFLKNTKVENQPSA